MPHTNKRALIPTRSACINTPRDTHRARMPKAALGRVPKGAAHKRKQSPSVLNPTDMSMLADHEELLELRAWRDALLEPLNAFDTFDLNHADQKVEIARQLWLGGYDESLQAL